MSKFSDELAVLIEKFFGGSQREDDQVEVTKSLDEEQRMAMFVVLEPETVDLHGDIYSELDVEKACNNFNLYCNKANLFHRVETEEAKIVQSYIAPVAMTLDSGQDIRKGTWVQWWYFPETETGNMLWDGVKAGDINGVSIGAKATVEKLDE